jgi:hypothetical protein
VGEKLVAAVTRAEEDAEEARRDKDRAAATDAARRAARLERAVDARDLQAWLRPLESLKGGEDEEGQDQSQAVTDEEAERRRLPLSHLLPRRFLRAPAPVPCRERCGAEFCSSSCEAKAWSRWHCLLCPGNTRRRQQQPNKGNKGKAAAAATAPTAVVEAGVRVDRAAVARFLEHADGNNDIFRVAAQVVALLLVEADRLLLEAAAGGEETTPKAALARAALPFACAHRKPWWECVARPEDVEPGDEEAEFRAQLRSLAADSLALLSDALKPERKELAEALLGCSSSSSLSSSAAALDAYGSFVGMFELNNLALNVPPPLDAYVALLNGDELPSAKDEGGESDCEEEAGASSSSAAAAAAADPPAPTEAERDAAAALVAPLLDAMGDDLAGAGTQGTAFYALQSCCNHACAPAARAEGRARGDIALVALRDLAIGEELTISYLPLDDDDDGEEEDCEEEEEGDGGADEEEQAGDEEPSAPPPPPVVPMPLAERRAALRDYGFECACERCEAEELAEAVGNC